MKRVLIALFACVLAVTFWLGCTRGNIFPQLTDQLAGISDMIVDEASNRLYVVNANEKVAYNWNQGSFQVYDITDPLAPVLIATTPTLSFSGKLSIDTTRKLAYVTNRFSEDEDDMIDRMYIFNIDESSPDFMTYTEMELGRDPFGIQCCYPADRLWIAEGGKNDDFYTQFVDKDTLAVGNIDMLVDLSNGGYFTHNETTDLVLLGSQAFMSRSSGGIIVINMDEAETPGAEPVDYWIEDIRTPRGITTDGNYVYIVSEEDETGEWQPWVHVLDVSSLVPLFDNTSAQVLDKNNDNLLVASIGLNERRDPQEILLTQDYIFVTQGWNQDNYVEVADRSTLTWLTEIPTDEEPFAMALYAPGGVETYVYIANQISNTIQVLDLATLSIIATYP